MESDRALRGYALLITTLSSFLTPFMSSALNVAVPAMSGELRADPLASTWVVSVYLVAAAALLLPSGRLADLVGRKKVFVAGLLVYGVSSVLAMVATSVTALIAFRAFQGIGGAMVFGTAVAILTSVYPPAERGRVLGINTAATYAGLSLGPVLGGILTQQFGWRSIFLFNAVLALVIVPVILIRLRGEWAGAAGERFDWAGSALYSVALVVLMYGVSSIQSVPYARWLALAGVLGLGVFVWVEMRARQPVLDLRRFRGNIPFIFSNLAALIHYSATFAIGYLLSRYLQEVQGISPRTAGLILLAQPVVMALFSPPAGGLSERVEPRVLSSAGMALMVAGLLLLSFFQAGTSLAAVLGVQCLIGFGYALFSSPNTNAIMGSVAPRDYGVASSTLGTMRLIGQALSMAIVLLLFSIYVGRAEDSAGMIGPLLTTMKVGFRLFAGLAAVGTLASLARGKVRE